jgi:hypothetical protein
VTLGSLDDRADIAAMRKMFLKWLAWPQPRDMAQITDICGRRRRAAEPPAAIRARSRPMHCASPGSAHRLRRARPAKTGIG